MPGGAGGLATAGSSGLTDLFTMPHLGISVATLPPPEALLAAEARSLSLTGGIMAPFSPLSAGGGGGVAGAFEVFPHTLTASAVTSPQQLGGVQYRGTAGGVAPPAQQQQPAQAAGGGAAGVRGRSPYRSPAASPGKGALRGGGASGPRSGGQQGGGFMKSVRFSTDSMADVDAPADTAGGPEGRPAPTWCVHPTVCPAPPA